MKELYCFLILFHLFGVCPYLLDPWISCAFPFPRKIALRMQVKNTEKISNFQSKGSQKILSNLKFGRDSALSFTQQLKNIAFHNTLELEPNEKDQFLLMLSQESGLLQDICKDSQSVSDLLWVFGKLGIYPVDQTQNQLVLLIITSFIQVHQRKHSYSESRNLINIAKGFGGISKMRLRWDKFPHDVKFGLLKILENNLDLINAQGVANIIHSLAVLQLKSKKLNETMNQVILRNLGRSLFEMNDKSLSLSMYGLGVMEYHRNNFTIPVMVDIGTMLVQFMPNMSSQSICNTLYGLACMKFQMFDFSSALIESVIEQYVRILPTLELNIGMGSSFYSLAKLGLSLNDWKTEERGIIEDYLIEMLPKMNPIAVSTLIYSLGRMDLKWSEIPSYLRKSLIDSLYRLFLQMNSQAIANSIQGLSLMNMKWKQLPILTGNVSVLSLWLQHIEQQLPSMKNKEIVSLILSLGRMEFRLHPTNVHWNKSMIEQLVKRFPTFQNREIANVIYGLALNKFQWKRFSFEQNQIIQFHISKKIAEMTEQGYANTVYGLAMMGVKWELIEPHLRFCLQQSIKTNIHEMSAYGVCNSLYGLSLLGLNWKNMRQHDQERIQLGIQKIIDSMNELSASYSLFSLGVIEVSWNDLLSVTKIQLCAKLNQTSSSMTVQELASAMYGTALLSFDFPYDIPFKGWTSEHKLKPHFQSALLLWYIHSRFLNAYKRIIQSNPNIFENDHNDDSVTQATVQMSIYFELMRTRKYTQSLVEELLETSVPSLQGSSTMDRSPYITRVTTALTEKLNTNSNGLRRRFTIKEEFDGLLNGVYPVDIAIFRNFPTGEKRLMALVEIDGSSHYVSPKGTENLNVARTLRRGDLLKEYLYSTRFPGVPLFRIPVMKISKLGTMEVIQPILQELCPT